MQAQRGQLWNGTAQFLYRNALENAMPQLREWRDGTNGREYLQDMHALLGVHPEELHDFEEKFPDVTSERDRLGERIGGYGLAVMGSPSSIMASPTVRWRVSENINTSSGIAFGARIRFGGILRLRSMPRKASRRRETR